VFLGYLTVILGEDMSSKPEDLLVEEKPLDIPSLKNIAEALQEGLSKNFVNVEVSVEDCPDLTKAPFLLAEKGLGGSPTIVEVGRVPYLMPLVNRSKIYDFKDMNLLTGVDPAFIIGAGAGPFLHATVNCELIANVVVKDNQLSIQKTQIAKLKDESKGNEFVAEKLPDSESTYALMGNLFVSKGETGQVVKVKVSKRKGKSDFVSAARDSLVGGFPGKSIGVGGVFLTTNSKVKLHIMPDFSKTALETEDQINSWLRFYEMNPPLVSVGTFVTNDPGLNLRLIHFHTFSEHGHAGHYHYDLDPDNVEYLAYFNLGAKVVRIDRPLEESKLGHN